MNQETIQIKIQDKILSIDARFIQVSELFQDLFHANTQQSDEEIPEFLETRVTLEIFEYIKMYYEQNNFKPEQVMLSGNILNIPQKDKDLIFSLNNKLIEKIYSACMYLQFKELEKLCLVKIYYDYTFDPADDQAMTKLFSQFPQSIPIKIKDIQEYQK